MQMVPLSCSFDIARYLYDFDLLAEINAEGLSVGLVSEMFEFAYKFVAAAVVCAIRTNGYV